MVCDRNRAWLKARQSYNLTLWDHPLTVADPFRVVVKVVSVTLCKCPGESPAYYTFSS